MSSSTTDRPVAGSLEAVERELGVTLPIIRVRAYRPWYSFFTHVEIVGMYADRLVVNRGRKSDPVPDSVYEPDGAQALQSFGGRGRASFSAPLEEVERVVVEKSTLVRRRYRFRVTARRRSCRFEVLAHETPNCLSFLERSLGPRYRLKGFVRIPGSPRRLALYLLLLAVSIFAAWLGTRLRTGTLSNLLMGLFGLFLIASPVWLIIEFFDVIPLGYKEPRGRKGTPGRDLSRRRPFRSRPVGYLLRFTGTVLLLTWFGLFTDLSAITDLVIVLLLKTHFWAVFGGNLIFWLALKLLLPIAGVTALFTGFALTPRGPRTPSGAGGRPLALYLRSFADDKKNPLLPPRSFVASVLGHTPPLFVRQLPFPLDSVFNLHPIRILRAMFGRFTDTSEQQLAILFRNHADFCAIGRPGERFPVPGGADRQYVNQEEWKEAVIGLLEAARYVVIQPAKTEGVWWEVETVLSRVPPERLLMCLSNFRGRQNDYERFWLRVKAATGWELPRSVGNRTAVLFLFFGPDRRFYERELSYYSPVVWPVLGRAADLKYTLADYLEPPDHVTAAYHPKRHRGHGLLALVLYLVVVPVVFFLLTCALNLVAELLLKSYGRFG